MFVEGALWVFDTKAIYVTGIQIDSTLSSERMNLVYLCHTSIYCVYCINIYSDLVLCNDIMSRESILYYP